MEDILVTPKANRKRWQLIESSRCCGEEAAASALGLPENCERYFRQPANDFDLLRHLLCEMFESDFYCLYIVRRKLL